MKKNNKKDSKRILGRQVAKELSKQELTAIVGGVGQGESQSECGTCSCGCVDD